MRKFEEGNPQTDEVKEWVNSLASQLEEESEDNYFISVDYGSIDDDYIVLVHGYFDEETDKITVVETATYGLEEGNYDQNT
ncbi:hypothetical protein [Aquibacillus saliphilus]|uniref:hypothetical protein n=1 Tax=Aquibacillus saliphilus TaxID=1909422 RepID=UPI001CF001B8|nr:hypothetical protein [Aquibacillus saliphilus]